MHSILEQFANGELPESMPSNQTPEYKRALTIAADYEQKLLTKLNDEEKAIFQTFIDAQLDLEDATGTEKFIEGYKLGMLMAIEVFWGESSVHLQCTSFNQTSSTHP